ncbi:Piezo non-specific cation channel, R-Ras-binding domain,Piezo domain [Cinara cedri]|uniref:Piezo non-specific cation channel, R-Ras-binding domain,Piezo domain n=1 Tax=Cinara cedri TaxID=506608 RepID=A0A5E4MA85_9HEMI|nr:Piezo non-specific cation channel, R-Ras-binding domain,Piezo domain [Cinara cedri]
MAKCWVLLKLLDESSGDDVGLTFKAFGFVYDAFDITLDTMLMIVFALALRYLRKYDMTYIIRVDYDDSSSLHPNLNVSNHYLLFTWKYLCLAILCLNAIMTIIALFPLKENTIVYLFRTICYYTCLHILVLFAYQLRSILHIDIDTHLAKQIGFINYRNSLECDQVANTLPVLRGHHYFLPVLLIVQKHLLWFYSDTISKKPSRLHSTEKLYLSKHKLLNTILIGIRTIGFRAAVLTWSIDYPGWLTLTMLLWTTVFWMYLNSRRNLIIILLFSICTLLIEYIYIIVGIDVLKEIFGSDLKVWAIDTRDYFPTAICIKTLYTLTFWIAIDQFYKWPKHTAIYDHSKSLSMSMKSVLPYTWISLLILTMLAYGFFGYNTINLIQIGYIALALLFLVWFQISFRIWKTIIYLYWTVVVLYSIIVVTVRYVFQFYGIVDIMTKYLNILNELRDDIGLDETGHVRIFIPAAIAIAIHVYFQYFHKPFINTLEIKKRIYYFPKRFIDDAMPNSHQSEVLIQMSWLWRIWDTTALFFHIHLDKLETALIAILITTKPCLLSGILLLMLLWLLLDYKKCLMHIIVSYIVLCIIITVGYQFSYFTHEQCMIQFQAPANENIKHNNIHTHKLNIAELIGLKKFNSNELLVYSIKYELLIVLVMVYKKTIIINLRHKYHPRKIPDSIFPNITYADINKGISEFLMYLVNDGFYLFGVEITFTIIAIAISLCMDLYGFIWAVLLLGFSIQNKRTVLSCWPYFISFAYLMVIAKYILEIIISSNLNYVMSWRKINIIQNTSIILYDQSYGAWIRPLMQFDFILLFFITRQLTGFKKLRVQNSPYKSNTKINNSNMQLSDNDDEFPDYISENKSYLDVIKYFVFDNSSWMILFFIFWNSINHVNAFSIGYLFTGTMFFWIGTYYHLVPLDKIIKLWRWLLYYNVSVILVKVFFHLFGCLLLNYFQWYSCILMRILSTFCLNTNVDELQKTCGTLRNDIGLFWDVVTFMLLLFQKRFFKSGHFLRLIEDEKATVVLVRKLANLFNGWEHRINDEARKTDLNSLEKIKVKLNEIRKFRKGQPIKQLTHNQACEGSVRMFDKIYDDVYLVKNHDKINNLPIPENLKNDLWIYRHFVGFILYLTKLMNRYSYEHRRMMHTLNTEKKLLKEKKSELAQMGYHKGSFMIWTPVNNNIQLINVEFDEDEYKHRHWLIQFVMALFYIMHSSTHLFCYFAIFYNAIHNSYDLVSIIPVLMIIFWGQLSVPRPTKTFWIVLFMYMQVTGLVKYICSFEEIPWIDEEMKLNHLSSTDFHSYPTIQIGIGNYKKKILPDLLVLIILFIHRRTLMRSGHWTYHNDHKNKWKKISLNIVKRITSLRLIILNIQTHLTPMIQFYKDLRRYHAKGTVNMYPIMFILIAIQIPYSLIHLRNAEELVESNRISLAFVQTFLTCIITIVIDRWLSARRFILGKLIFHLIFLIGFIRLMTDKNKAIINNVLSFNIYAYIVVSAYQLRNGYSYRYSTSFIWSRYEIYNLVVHKAFYYCPFLHEICTVLDWMWSDSSLTIMQWFKMEELFTHVCCVKCICNVRDKLDDARGMNRSRKMKLLIGGGILTAFLSIIIFPIAWFSMFKSMPDTPSSVELTIRIFEESVSSIIFSTKSDDIHKLDSTDYSVMKEVYMSTLSNNWLSSMEFLQQYEFDEISSINLIPQSINTWPITFYEFTKLNKMVSTRNSSIKASAEWILTHHNGMKISRGINIVVLNKTTINMLIKYDQKLIIPNLVPKFLILHWKSTETEIASGLMIHNPSLPYMDVGITFYENPNRCDYLSEMVEICPSNNDTIYLKKIPYSSCADEDTMLDTNNTNMLYNIYVFSDRYSNKFHFLDDKGIIGLYTIIVVYFGYKLAFDIFRSFKFKLGFTETPYPDRLLQLCYEIYLVRSFAEYEMEEDLYGMLIFLFRSPEILIRFTKRPNEI